MSEQVRSVPSNDMRLDLDGVQKTACPSRNNQDLSPWLASAMIVFLVSFNMAVVNPPGGVWAADDEASGRVAGAPIMSSRFPVRYKLFRCSNAAAVICSLMLIGMLLKHVGNQEPIIKKNTALVILAILCFLSFVVSCSVVFYMYVTSVNA
jgi:hypothetical protein